MPNGDQVLILKGGVSVWNEWRHQHPDVRPDLSCADLRGLDVGCYNEDYYHEMDELRHEIEMGEGTFVSILDLTEEQIVVDDDDMYPQNGFDLRKANLSNVMLDGASLVGAHLAGANLEEATLDGCNLVHASLRDANLSGASLQGANLRFADLTRANLTGSVLDDADLSGAKLDETVMTGSAMGATAFGDNELSTIVGLDQVRHSGPSTIGIDTLYKSRGSIPVVFLRRIGVPETLITFIKSQAPQDLNFPACFISYAEPDDAFSERLLGDLESSGVRCWRWKEDAPWGKPLRKSIHEAIQDYDKLILICSESSLSSPAVIREVERALHKEDNLVRKGKPGDVLFPLCLDDFIFEWQHDLKEDITNKHIGDFRNWSEPDSYRKALERLLQDLRS
jgi:TIR domain/Pentapeptide repeats (8 copies)